VDTHRTKTLFELKPKQVSADQIAAWFERWKKVGKRRWHMPTAADCRPIADCVNATSSPIPELIRQVRYAQYAEQRGAKQTAAIVRRWEYQDSVVRDIIKHAKSLHGALTQFTTFQGETELFEETPLEVEDLKVACAAFVDMVGSKRRGRPTINDDVVCFSMEAAAACRKVLIGIGWRKNASLDSDNGPVSFVVSQCLRELHGEIRTPASIGRMIRSAKKKLG